MNQVSWTYPDRIPLRQTPDTEMKKIDVVNKYVFSKEDKKLETNKSSIHFPPFHCLSDRFSDFLPKLCVSSHFSSLLLG